jgi:hypothetical protein
VQSAELSLELEGVGFASELELELDVAGWLAASLILLFSCVCHHHGCNLLGDDGGMEVWRGEHPKCVGFARAGGRCEDVGRE